MWLLLIIVAVLIFGAYLHHRKTYGFWEKRNVPYLKPVPILGNSAPMMLRQRSFVDHIKFLYNAYPKDRYFGAFQFMTPQLLVRDPELIKQITVKDFQHFIDRTSVITEESDPIFGKNLLGLKGQKWRDMRSTLSPSFTSSKMKFLFTLISDCAEQFTNYFDQETAKGNTVDIDAKDTFSRFTNDAIASAAFGVSVDSLKNKENEFFLRGKDVTSFKFYRMLVFFAYALFPSIMRYFKVPVFPRDMSEFLQRIVRETITLRQEKGVVRPDMIHLLLEASKETAKQEDETHTGEGFAAVNELLVPDKDQKHKKSVVTENDIVAQAMLFFFGGFETSSVFMCFLAYEMALNPKVQEKLQGEVDKIKNRGNGKISYEEIMAMKYLDMVVSEALRKWTPGAAIDRICVKDYQIEPKLPGESPFTVEKGTTIFIPTIGIHYDPQYFPEPEKFDPERFSDENKSNILPFTYMPFGSGPRNCIASRFALLEVKILLCHMLAKYDIVPTSKTVIPMVLSKKSFTLQPDGGIWLGLKKRV